MSLPRYPKYRDSGLDWLGDIPVDWHQPKRFGEISSLKGRLGWQGLKADEYRAEGPYVVSSAHFSDFRIRWEDCPRVSDARYEADINIQLYEGDVLLMKDGAAMGKLAFIDSLPGPACLNSHLLLFRPLTLSGAALYVPKFAFYFMQTGFFQEHIRVNGTGATFLGISQEAISRYRVAWPIIEEQEVIVSFLDRETAKIDALIAEQEKLLVLLAEKRQATISHAVTRGLDPNAPMKDSGIPWLGEVPAHWEVKPLKRIARLITGMTPPTDDEENYGEDGHPWIRPEDLDERGFPSTPSRFLSAKGWGGARHVAPNASLICCIGSIGKVGFVDSCVSTNQQITAAEFSGNGRFFYYVTCAARRELELSATGNVLRILNSERLGNLFYPSPTLGEQEEIAEFLDDETAKFDDLASEGVCAIGLLKERRAALIVAAVTGQIDVRGAVEPEAA